MSRKNVIKRAFYGLKSSKEKMIFDVDPVKN